MSLPCEGMVAAFDRLGATPTASIRVPVIGKDRWTTNVHNLLGLESEYPGMDVTVTTMMGFCAVDKRECGLYRGV